MRFALCAIAGFDAVQVVRLLGEPPGQVSGRGKPRVLASDPSHLPRDSTLGVSRSTALRNGQIASRLVSSFPENFGLVAFGQTACLGFMGTALFGLSFARSKSCWRPMHAVSGGLAQNLADRFQLPEVALLGGLLKFSQRLLHRLDNLRATLNNVVHFPTIIRLGE